MFVGLNLFIKIIHNVQSDVQIIQISIYLLDKWAYII